MSFRNPFDKLNRSVDRFVSYMSQEQYKGFNADPIEEVKHSKRRSLYSNREIENIKENLEQEVEVLKGYVNNPNYF